MIGCEASGAKQGFGALAGGAVGAFAGNKLLKKNKAMGTLAGAGAGAAAGSWIGCKMQRADQARAVAADSAPTDTFGEDSRRPYRASTVAAHAADPQSVSLGDLRFEGGVEPTESLTFDRAGRYVSDASLKIHTALGDGADCGLGRRL